MSLSVHFPGGKRVVATVAGFEVATDQPETAGGEGSAPSPFSLFLASLATCTGYFVHEFCVGRDLATDGLEVVQHRETDPESGHITGIRHEILLPPGFPAKYETAIVRAAESCTVKKLIQSAPTFVTMATRRGST